MLLQRLLDKVLGHVHPHAAAGGDGHRLHVGGVVARNTQSTNDLGLEKLHFGGFAVHQQHVARGSFADHLHDSFGVGVRAEGQVRYLALHVDGAALVDLQRASVPGNELVPHCTGHAVAWQNHHVPLHVAPLLEDVQRHASVQHARGSKQHAGPGLLDVAAVKRLHVTEVEHVVLLVHVLDHLIGPAHQQFVVHVRLGSESRGKIHWHCEAGALPVLFNQNG
mmetsp:Transcript_4763/g.9039  ORF Transcript_4763/g.9039 Transcript_4763/m.9039 type:complete len:222 (+) Transcript_4763:836-1501(+)